MLVERARVTTSRDLSTAKEAHRREQLVRLFGGILLLLGGLVGVVGFAWDVQWHVDLGRDRFLIPPHLMTYSSLALRGVVALLVVLYDTGQYHFAAPKASEQTTVTVFRWFHGPRGFVLAGFAVLAAAAAAPLDNYWHELYGIDVAVWAPFHVMGLIPMAVAGVGTVYALMDVAVAFGAAGSAGRPLFSTPIGWLVLVALATLLATILLLIEPAAVGDPLLRLGPIQIADYPLFVAFIPPLILIAALELSDQPGAALVVAALFTGLRYALLWLVPHLVTWLVQSEGLSYRFNHASSLILIPFAFPHWILITALVVEVLFLIARRLPPLSTRLDQIDPSKWWRVALIGIAGALVGVFVDQPNLRLARSAGPLALAVAAGRIDMGVLSNAFYETVFRAALPLVVVLGWIAAWVGRGWALLLIDQPGSDE